MFLRRPSREFEDHETQGGTASAYLHEVSGTLLKLFAINAEHERTSLILRVAGAGREGQETETGTRDRDRQTERDRDTTETETQRHNRH